MTRFCDEDFLVDSGTDGLVLEGTGGGCGWDSVLLDGWIVDVKGEDDVRGAWSVMVTVEKKCSFVIRITYVSTSIFLFKTSHDCVFRLSVRCFSSGLGINMLHLGKATTTLVKYVHHLLVLLTHMS